MTVTADEQIPEPIQKWIDALRSGRFEQTTGYLNNDGRFCCLGVACEVAVENGLKVKKDHFGSSIFSYDGESGILPKSVQNWLGMRTRDCGSLPYNNDVLRESFFEIANHIEKNWREMVV